MRHDDDEDEVECSDIVVLIFAFLCRHQSVSPMTRRRRNKPAVPRASDPTAADLHALGAAFDPAAYEESNVHEVYETIAAHFSDTRYKPWPLIPSFLATLPKGAIGADLGCGNGKYLGVRSCLLPSQAAGSEAQQGKLLQDDGNAIFLLGIDRSANLIDHAAYNVSTAADADGGQRKEGSSSAQDQRQPPLDTTGSAVHHSTEAEKGARNEVAVGDAITSNVRAASVDFAISIATIHHMATWARRRDAVAEMIRIVRPRTATGTSSAASERATEAHDQESDYPIFKTGSSRFMIVVWALEQRGASRRRFEEVATEEEKRHDANDDGISAMQLFDGPENAPIGKDLLVPWILKERPGEETKEDITRGPSKVYQRFYHVFREGELEALVDDAARSINETRRAAGLSPLSVDIEVSGWERGNWYGVWQCSLAMQQNG